MVCLRLKQLLTAIQYGCLLTKWQSCSSVTEVLLESTSEIFLKKVNCKKNQYGQNLPTLPTLREAVIAKDYLNEKELREMGLLVSGYLDFAERQAEREQAMTMEDWTKHLDRILTMSGEQLLSGNGSKVFTSMLMGAFR